jgi:hypothetical protein
MASLVNNSVRLHSLKAAGMNGRTGVVLAQPAASADRVQVLLSETQAGLGDSRTVALKPVNLEVVEDEPSQGSGGTNAAQGESTPTISRGVSAK